MFRRIKEWAVHLQKETYALYFAIQDPRTPWYAKLLAAFVVTHTLSPIDLIPDFIPVLGTLDDLIITPLGIWLSLKLIPEEVMLEARSTAESVIIDGKAIGRIGMIMIVSLWVTGLALIIVIALQFFIR